MNAAEPNAKRCVIYARMQCQTAAHDPYYAASLVVDNVSPSVGCATKPTRISYHSFIARIATRSGLLDSCYLMWDASPPAWDAFSKVSIKNMDPEEYEDEHDRALKQKQESTALVKAKPTTISGWDPETRTQKILTDDDMQSAPQSHHTSPLPRIAAVCACRRHAPSLSLYTPLSVFYRRQRHGCDGHGRLARHGPGAS